MSEQEFLQPFVLLNQVDLFRWTEWLQHPWDVSSTWGGKDLVRVQLSRLQVEQSKLDGGASEKALQWCLHVLLPESRRENVPVVNVKAVISALIFKAWKSCWILWSLLTLCQKKSPERQWEVLPSVLERGGLCASQVARAVYPFENIEVYSCYKHNIMLRTCKVFLSNPSISGVRSTGPSISIKVHPSNTFLKLYWRDSGSWRYQLDINS